jgi:hypothetical protein
MTSSMVVSTAKTKPYVTPRDLADRALVSDQAAYVWLTKHPGLGLKVAGRWRIRPEVADAIVAGLPLAEAARLGRAGR